MTSTAQIDVQHILEFAVSLAKEAGQQIKSASDLRWTSASAALDEKANSVDLVRSETIALKLIH